MIVGLDIIKQLMKGNKHAFQQIYNEYYEMLLYISMQYLVDKEDAKEAVQDAFVKLWLHKEGVDENLNIRNYLYTIVKNNSLNILKKQEIISRSQNDLKWMEMHYQYEAMERLGFDSIEFKELQHKVDEAINNLPEHCQKVFRLSRFSALKNKEIAQKLNISEKTVEAHMTKSLRLLRAELGEYLPFVILLFDKIL